MDDLDVKDVAAWLVGLANDQLRESIEQELEKPDSRVKDYLDWMHDPQAYRESGRPLPQLLRDYLEVVPRLWGRERRNATEVERLVRSEVGPHTSKLSTGDSNRSGSDRT